MELDIETYSFDDYIIEQSRNDRKPRLEIYRAPTTAVVLGKGSKPEVELNLEACARDEIPILKRHGGGCAVVIDPGNVIVSLVLPTEGITGSRMYFDRISKWLIGKLADVGIADVYQDGISDLVMDDRKIGGSSIQRSKDHLYYSSTLLVEPRLDLIDKYLKHPPREPEYRRGRSHREFLGRLQIQVHGDGVEWLVGKLRNLIVESELRLLL